MKKFFFFATSLLVAGSMMANVAIDLNSAKKPAHAADADAVTFSVASDVLTITASVSKGWDVNGAEFELEEPIAGADITAIKGSVLGTESEIWNSFIPYLVDTVGARWFNEDLEMALGDITEWTEFNYLPQGAPWDSPASTFAQCLFVKFGVYTNPIESISNYVFKVKDLTIVTKTAALPVVNAEGKATKAMVNGQLVIMRNGEVFNALGAAL